MPTYSPILDSEVDAESPITQSLMERLRDNPLALFGDNYTQLTGSGNYSVPTNINLLKVVIFGAGGGGGGGVSDTGDNDGGGGGGSGCVTVTYMSVSGGDSIPYACGSGGSGGALDNDGSDGGTTTFGQVDSGTTTSTSAGKLVQTGQNFTTTVSVNDVVFNTTDNTWTTVDAVDSDTQLDLANDIMVSGDSFEIYIAGGDFALGGKGGDGTTVGGASGGAINPDGTFSLAGGNGGDATFDGTRGSLLGAVKAGRAGAQGKSAGGDGAGGGGAPSATPFPINEALGDGGNGANEGGPDSTAGGLGAGGGGGSGDLAGGYSTGKAGGNGVIYIQTLNA